MSWSWRRKQYKLCLAHFFFFSRFRMYKYTIYYLLNALQTSISQPAIITLNDTCGLSYFCRFFNAKFSVHEDVCIRTRNGLYTSLSLCNDRPCAHIHTIIMCATLCSLMQCKMKKKSVLQPHNSAKNSHIMWTLFFSLSEYMRHKRSALLIILMSHDCTKCLCGELTSVWIFVISTIFSSFFLSSSHAMPIIIFLLFSIFLFSL